jgi:hypothetical protein
MIEFVGNCCHIIDWNEIVESLSSQKPAYVGPRHRENDPIKGISEIAKSWNQAGYVIAADGGTAGWDMFFPERNFDQSIVETFSNFVGIKPVSAWISRVNPGMFAPWHWDANDSEEEYNKMPNMLRFSCHVSKPSPGHVFIVEDTCLYNQAQGNIYKWPSRKSFHGGANCGLTPKYLFNIFGSNL